MATTLDNINLPSNPDLGAAEVGKDFLLFVNTGTVSTPEWQMIGGQRNSGLTRQAETIDVSHKTSADGLQQRQDSGAGVLTFLALCFCRISVFMHWLRLLRKARMCS